MADTFARMRQLIGSTSEWATNDIVLGYGEIGIERVSSTEYKAKVGDGSAKWSALPYLTAPVNTVNTATQAALDGKLALAGGTMTGDLILAHAGTKPLEPATFSQLQSEVTRLNALIAAKLATTGGTLTGPLVLPSDATQNLEAVTLQQLTKAIGAITGSISGGVTYAGQVNPTAAYVAPVPAPVNGGMYTSSKAGAFDHSWNAHVAGTPPTTVSIGDQFIFSTTDNKFHYVPVASSGGSGAYVPLAGTALMTGAIGWQNPQSGAPIIDGNGGAIQNALIDNGTY